MPIFRYLCKKCKAEFELLLPRFDAPAECPVCGSADLEKALNKVAAITRSSTACAMQASCPAATSCGCSGGCGCGHKH